MKLDTTAGRKRTAQNTHASSPPVSQCTGRQEGITILETTGMNLIYWPMSDSKIKTKAACILFFCGSEV
jgi:hypothetical protein